MKKKNWITKRIAKGMLEVSEIFRDKNKVSKGLKRDEIISLFLNRPLEKVVRMNEKTNDTEWSKIKTIKKHLIRTEQMAIIHRGVAKGTVLNCKEFGERILDKRSNIFFRCTTLEDAWVYRNTMDSISRGVEQTSDKVTAIAEGEKELIKEKVAIQVVRNK